MDSIEYLLCLGGTESHLLTLLERCGNGQPSYCYRVVHGLAWLSDHGERESTTLLLN